MAGKMMVPAPKFMPMMKGEMAEEMAEHKGKGGKKKLVVKKSKKKG